jgi:hypothetical protein
MTMKRDSHRSMNLSGGSFHLADYRMPEEEFKRNQMTDINSLPAECRNETVQEVFDERRRGQT